MWINMSKLYDFCRWFGWLWVAEVRWFEICFVVRTINVPMFAFNSFFFPTISAIRRWFTFVFVEIIVVLSTSVWCSWSGWLFLIASSLTFSFKVRKQRLSLNQPFWKSSDGCNNKSVSNILFFHAISKESNLIVDMCVCKFKKMTFLFEILFNVITNFEFELNRSDSGWYNRARKVVNEGLFYYIRTWVFSKSFELTD